MIVDQQYYPLHRETTMLSRAGDSGGMEKSNMKRFYVLKDEKIEASTATREGAIELIRIEQEREKKAHQWLHAEFSIIEGEQEFIKYEKTSPTPSADSTPSTDNEGSVAKTKELTENEVKTVLAVFGELRKMSYDTLNTFLGSITIDEMNQLNNKLNDWYQGEVLGKEYDEEFGWYEPSPE